MRRGIAVLALAFAAIAPASAQAQKIIGEAPSMPMAHAGRWITDNDGRVVILHGLNMVYKSRPYTPSTTGFGADDANFLRRYGFNTVRLGMIYAGVEPQPGKIDSAYINDVAKTQALLAKQGVISQIDFHQDLYNERFEGEGWPDWAVQDDGLPAEPKAGFPANYFGMPALIRAFDNFWANKPAAADGIGLQDHYAAAWRAVAKKFAGRPGLLGYDLMNEPWPGTPWASCLAAEGCPQFDGTELRGFYERVIPQIRRSDKKSLIWYEPNVIFNFGPATNVGRLPDSRLGFSFHDYCLAPSAGVPGGGEVCESSERTTLANADAHAAQAGSALLLSEFGATDDLTTLENTVTLADEHMISWQEWHYCNCEDPTTTGAGDRQALVLDPAKPPTGANVVWPKLRVLVRPYPQVIAGTPTGYSFDPSTRRFELRYEKARASGHGAFGRGVTNVYVPKLHYPKGYKVAVRGASVLSKPGAQHLILRGHRKARAVNVTVTPR